MCTDWFLIVSCIPLAVRLCGKSCSDNCRQHVCAVGVRTSMALAHFVDGCKFHKALTSDIVRVTCVLFMGYLRVLSAQHVQLWIT